MFQIRYKFDADPVLAIANVSQKGTDAFRHDLNRRAGTSFGDIEKWVLVPVAKGLFQAVPHTPQSGGFVGVCYVAVVY